MIPPRRSLFCTHQIFLPSSGGLEAWVKQQTTPLFWPNFTRRESAMAFIPFMVQIRSMENHEPLPGTTVGEIGPKMGMRAADNGFLKLDHVRIPRENMLMKNAQVTKEGDYIKPASDKLNYGTMVFVRVLLLDMFAFNIARACTIAIRYSAVRRQSEITPGQGENQIMDYQAQQYKLFPLLGLCHSLRAMFANLMELYKQANQDMEQGNLEMLPELHAISSGLKAFCSDMAAKGIETCRLACGGHGFLLISGLPRLYATTVAACTYEGENTVMYLQAARYMIKCLAQPQQLSRNSTFRFLLEPGTLRVPPFNARLKGREAIRQLVPFYRAAAYKQVHRADTKVKSLIKSGLTPEIAWNHSQVDLIIASKATVLYYLGLNYLTWVENSNISERLRDVLLDLCHLYLLHGIYEQPGLFLVVGLQGPGPDGTSRASSRSCSRGCVPMRCRWWTPSTIDDHGCWSSARGIGTTAASTERSVPRAPSRHRLTRRRCTSLITISWSPS
uniref:Putative peroxisomal acyl-coa oxidase n=1 Tax=Ixodes ricinus TaxID=34613 RepID=V5GK88_IXORI